MDLERITALLAPLKGPPLSVLLAMIALNRPTGRLELMATTDYCTHAVTRALTLLREHGLIERRAFHNGWVLAPGVRKAYARLMLSDAGNRPEGGRDDRGPGVPANGSDAPAPPAPTASQPPAHGGVEPATERHAPGAARQPQSATWSEPPVPPAPTASQPPAHGGIEPATWRHAPGAATQPQSATWSEPPVRPTPTASQPPAQTGTERSTRSFSPSQSQSEPASRRKTPGAPGTWSQPPAAPCSSCGLSSLTLRETPSHEKTTTTTNPTEASAWNAVTGGSGDADPQGSCIDADPDAAAAAQLLIDAGCPAVTRAGNGARDAVREAMARGWSGAEVLAAVRSWFAYADSERGRTIDHKGFFTGAQIRKLQRPRRAPVSAPRRSPAKQDGPWGKHTAYVERRLKEIIQH